MPKTNARISSLRALVRWETTRSFCDDVHHEFSSRLETSERALFTEIFFGVLRNRSLLDFWIQQFRAEAIDGETRNVLRLGFYQIMRMRIPDHAAVNETVNLAGRSRSLVNAVLRKAVGGRTELEAAEAVAPLSTRSSHPEFLLERWTKQFGEQGTESLCAWNNQPAPLTVRANTIKVTAGELLRSFPESTQHALHPLAIITPRLPFSWLVGGLCYVQDPSTLAACDLLDPQSGDRVLDACAAPGGKTTYLAALMGDKGHIIACDSEIERLKILRQNLGRLNIRNTEIQQVDWKKKNSFLPESFDRILLDAPCTNTGVMRRRIDVRWRLRPTDFESMQKTQMELVRAVVPLLKPGGVFVYSTCSLDLEENDRVVELIRGEFPDLRLDKVVRVLPQRDGVDGAFAAKFVHKISDRKKREAAKEGKSESPRRHFYPRA